MERILLTKIEQTVFLRLEHMSIRFTAPEPNQPQGNPTIRVEALSDDGRALVSRISPRRLRSFALRLLEHVGEEK